MWHHVQGNEQEEQDSVPRDVVATKKYISIGSCALAIDLLCSTAGLVIRILLLLQADVMTTDILDPWDPVLNLINFIDKWMIWLNR